MTAGLFDLPAPLFGWADERLNALLPAPAAIVLWAFLGGIAAIEIYRLASPQRQIARAKRDAGEAQRRLAGFDGEFGDAWPLMRRMLGVSLKRVALVVPGTLLAAYPVVALLLWLDSDYGHRWPRLDEAVAVTVPAPWQGRWNHAEAGQPPRVTAHNPGGEPAFEVPFHAPVPVVHKRRWWNALAANPAGYLHPGAPVEEVRVELPRREIVAAGPAWARGWEPLFLAALTLAALAYKRLRGVH